MQISPKLLNALYIGGLFKKTANGTLVRACTRKGALFAFLEGSQDQVLKKYAQTICPDKLRRGLQVSIKRTNASGDFGSNKRAGVCLPSFDFQFTDQ